MQGLTSDLRYATRRLRQVPLQLTAIILVLALGVGLSEGLVRLISAAGEITAGLPSPGQLVGVYETSPSDPGQLEPIAPALYRSWAGESLSTAVLAAYVPLTMDWTHGVTREPVRTAVVTNTYLSVLGVHPVLGRGFSSGSASADEALVSGGFAARLMADGRQRALGTMLEINRREFTVVGVLPAGAAFPPGTDVWLVNPYRAHALSNTVPDIYPSFSCVGRLRSGVSVSALAAELTPLAVSLRGTARLRVQPLGTAFARQEQQDLGLAAVAGALLAVLAAVALGALLTVRAAARSSELALRVALGATPWQAARLVALEGVLVGVAGGGLGAGLSWALLWVARRVRPPQINWQIPQSAGWTDLALTVALAGGIGGVIAWVSARRTLDGQASAHAGGATKLAASWAWVIPAQLALCLTLLASAFALGATLWGTLTARRGFDADGASAFRLELTGPRTEASSDALVAAVMGRLADVPGVQSVGAINLFPFDGDTFPTEVSRSPAAGQPVTADYVAVTAAYFRAMGMSLRGRWPAPGDPASVVISASLAAHLWPGRPALGRTLSSFGKRFSVAAIASDVDPGTPGAASPAVIYLPWARSPIPWTSMTVVVRSALTLDVPQLQRAVALAGGEATVRDYRTLGDIEAALHADLRLLGLLFGAAGAISVLIAVVGLGGALVAEAESRRTEYAVRIALGADRRSLLTLAAGRVGLQLALGCPPAALGAGWLIAALTASLRQPLPLLPPILASVALLSGVVLLVSLLSQSRSFMGDPSWLLRSL